MEAGKRAEDEPPRSGEAAGGETASDAAVPEGIAEVDKRQDGVVVDLEALERQAEELYLHRFVEYVKKVRGQHGRFLTLRAGDELAIEAAGDGSAESLKDVLAETEHGDGA